MSDVTKFPVSNAAESEMFIRRGDGVMCVRFWGEITRDVMSAARQRLLTRAFHPKARSHAPITAPGVVGGCAKSGESCSVAKLGSDPNSGQGVRACQNSITDLGSDPNFAALTEALFFRLWGSSVAMSVNGEHDD